MPNINPKRSTKQKSASKKKAYTARELALARQLGVPESAPSEQAVLMEEVKKIVRLEDVERMLHRKSRMIDRAVREARNQAKARAAKKQKPRPV
jgi:hypothetical protein